MSLVPVGTSTVHSTLYTAVAASGYVASNARNGKPSGAGVLMAGAIGLADSVGLGGAVKLGGKALGVDTHQPVQVVKEDNVLSP